MADMAGFPGLSFLADIEALRTAKPPASRQESSSYRSDQIGTACFIPAHVLSITHLAQIPGCENVNAPARPWRRKSTKTVAMRRR
jgi:hypothetical protein